MAFASLLPVAVNNFYSFHLYDVAYLPPLDLGAVEGGGEVVVLRIVVKARYAEGCLCGNRPRVWDVPTKL